MLRIHQKVDYLLHNNITELYVTQAIRTFAGSIISLFVPLYLINQGYSLISVAFYLILQYSIYPIFIYPTMKLASKKGVKHTMLLSAPLSIAYFLVLYNLTYLQELTSGIFVLILLALIHSIGEPLYWNGYHIEFSKFSKDKNEKQVGWMNIFATIAAAIGPLIGGFAIVLFDFNPVFITVMCLLFISIFPLFLSKEIHEPFEFSFQELIKKSRGKLVFPYFAEGVKFIGSSISWPLMLYFLYSNYQSIGGIYTVSHTLVIVFTYFVSHKITDLNRTTIMKWGTYIHASSMVIRVFITNFSTLNVIQGIGGISWAMIHIPFASTFYSNTKKVGITSSIFFREIYLHLGRVCGAIILAIFLLITSVTNALAGSLIIGALFTILMGTLKKLDNV